ncbi:MAG: recombinase family protein [Pseudomonadota bacterium]
MTKATKTDAPAGQFVGYARVSTQDQDLQLQLEALEAAGCTRIYQEKASGAKADRDELSRMLEFVREGDTVVVYKLDRLARSMKQLFDLVEFFDQNGIGFKTLTGVPVDTTTNHGRLVFNIFSAIAEFERGLIVERTQAGRERAKAQGIKMGRPSISDETVAEIRSRIAEGQSWSTVAAEMGIGRRTVARYAKPNETTSAH